VNPRHGVVAALIVVVSLLVAGSPAIGESTSMQQEISTNLISQGFWDESSTLDPTQMGEIVAQFGDSFAFAYTDRAFEVQDPNQSAAALLALSTLGEVELNNGPRTLLFVTDDEATGASNEFPFINILQVLGDFDRSQPEASFAEAAQRIQVLGTEVSPSALEAAQADTSALAQAGDPGFFSGVGPFIILAVVTAVLAFLALGSSKKKKSRRIHTAPARDTTAAELQEMSDLILDLDPRVTIENDADLKARFVDAGDTYRSVLEDFQSAQKGHELADLRIDISKARWKLDVIDAELDGREPPAEPYTRDSSGSAWDSTRGDGAS